MAAQLRALNFDTRNRRHGFDELTKRIVSGRATGHRQQYCVLTRGMRSILTEHDVKLLNELYRKLPPLTWEATNALLIFAPARSLVGADLAKFLAAHAQVQSVFAKMADILGSDVAGPQE